MERPATATAGTEGVTRDAVRWAALGLCLSMGAPIGLWVVLRLLDLDGERYVGPVLLYVGVSTAVVFVAFGWIAGSLLGRLRRSAAIDVLTGLPNRRLLMEVLPHLVEQAGRSAQPLCALMLDLDHFKRVNDRHGHAVGDQTLRALGEVIRDNVRAADVAARYGGEEFVVACPQTDVETAVRIAERLRAAVADMTPAQLGHDDGQTVSIGVAAWAVGEPPAGLLERADGALYRAKAEGRDRVAMPPGTAASHQGRGPGQEAGPHAPCS